MVTINAIPLLDTLAQAYSKAAQSQGLIQNDIIKGQIEKQLKAKIAALQGPVDTVLIQSNQDLIGQLQKQLGGINQDSNSFSAAGTVFSDLVGQLAAMHTAIANGDVNTFSDLVRYAYNDIANLPMLPVQPPYQLVDIVQLKTNGLQIKDATSYDLSTQAGQDAANADVQAAQDAMLQLSATVTSNQLIAYNNAAALTDQINSLNKTLTSMQNQNDDYISQQTDRLTQLAQNQEHLIQLALGKTTTLSTALGQMVAQAQPPQSPFAVLSSDQGTATNGASPAILSLLT